MDDVRREARDCLQRFANAWIDGDYRALGAECRPAIEWWSPLRSELLHGTGHLTALMKELVDHVARPIEITALIVNDSGSRGVLELLSPGIDGNCPTAITSVVCLVDAAVSTGRTYVDIDERA